MTIKQKYKKSSKQKPVVIVGLAALMIVAGVSTYLVLHNTSRVSADTAEAPVAESSFTFNESAAPNWYKGPGNETSQAVFHNEKQTGCFTYMHYKDDSESESEWLSGINEGRDDTYYDSVPGDTLTQEIQTDKGVKQYKLRQYTNQLKEGLAEPKEFDARYEAETFGYIALDKGHILIQGYCTPGDMLPEISTALQAFSFDSTKL